MRHHHIYINYFIKRGRSFVYAWQGIVSLFGNEPNARIHLCVALLVVAAGFFFNISASEWCLVTLCIGGVLWLRLSILRSKNSATRCLLKQIP